MKGHQSAAIRDTPELNIGDQTKVEVFHDSNFADAVQLESASRLEISSLTDGSRDVSVVAQIVEWAERNFTNSDGEEKTLWGGEIIDPTGKSANQC